MLPGDWSRACALARVMVIRTAHSAASYPTKDSRHRCADIETSHSAAATCSLEIDHQTQLARFRAEGPKVEIDQQA